MANIETTQPDIKTNNALEQPLGGALLTSLTANTPYFRYGSGASLLPTAPMGQIAMPGPNQSVFGNPFAGDVGQSFGPSVGLPSSYQMLGSGGAGGLGTWRPQPGRCPSLVGVDSAAGSAGTVGGAT